MTDVQVQNPLKALTQAPACQVAVGFAGFMQGARQSLAPKVPKNSQEVYQQAMQGLSEEAERLTEISDAATYSPDLDKRAGIAVKRAGVLGKMIDVEKTKVDLLKANLDVDTVVFAVFSAVTDALEKSFDDVPATEEERSRWRMGVLNALKEHTQDLRSKIDGKILEVRETLPKVERRVQGREL